MTIAGSSSGESWADRGRDSRDNYLKSKGVEGLSEQLVPGPIGWFPLQSLFDLISEWAQSFRSSRKVIFELLLYDVFAFFFFFFRRD